MTTFAMYVGLPASGKSTIAHQHEDAYVIIDSDETRQKLLGDANDQTQNARVFEHMYKETCECLSRGISCAYVATNLSSRRRINLIQSLRQKFDNVEYVCYIINTPLDDCYQRNAVRERRVPDYVISRMVRSFECPSLAEGFDRVEVIDNYDKTTPNEEFDKIMAKVNEYGNQGNNHHTLTLTDHCSKCAHYVLSHWTNDRELQRAAFIHDCGKAYTATRWSGDKDDGQLHYPSHAQVGSYLALNMGYSLYVAQLVGAHMYPYMDEKARNVWAGRLGPDFWKEVMRLHGADEAAH